MIVRKESEIFRRLLSYVLARTQMSDIRETDPLVKVCAAVASEIAKGDQNAWNRRNEGFVDGSEGEVLDSLLREYLPNGITRDDGAYASGGDIVFYRPTGSSGALTVVAGTVVRRPRDGMLYKTLLNATFGVSDLTSTAVPAVCLTKGARGNVIVVGEINALGAAVAGVSSCSNTSTMTNGADADSDETARNKARDYVKSISPCIHSGILYRVVGYESDTYGSVKFAKWADLNIYRPGFQTLYIDDGNGTSGPIINRNALGLETFTAAFENGKFTLFTRYSPVATAPDVTYNSGTAVSSELWAEALGQVQVTTTTAPLNGLFTFTPYTTYGGLVGEVQNYINGVINDPNDSGINGAGLVITVLPAVFQDYTEISANVLFADGANVTTVTAQIKASLVTQINTLWTIGQNLTIADVTTIIKGVAGVTDVYDITINGVATSKIALPYEVIRTRTTDITIY